MLKIKGATYRRASLSELTLNPRNCRKHGEQDLLVLSASLEKFGQVEPLVVRKADKLIIGGNGRLEAMLSLSWTECDIAEVDCTEEEATKLGIVLNRSAELSTWDDEAVEAALRGIQEDDPVIADMLDGLAKYLDIVPGVEAEASPPVTITCPECGHVFERKSEN